jgi:hypothetical protein
MSATTNISNEIVSARSIEISCPSEGPWIPQTPDSQEGSDIKEQWQDREEE